MPAIAEFQATITRCALSLVVSLLLLGCSNGRGSVGTAQPPTSEQPPPPPPPETPPPATPPPSEPPPEPPPPPAAPGLPPVEPPPPAPPPEPPPSTPPGVPPQQSFDVGGTVQGLSGRGLVLQRNGGDDLPIASNGSFTFPTAQASGSTYDVRVSVQPLDPSQTCTVAGGSGTVGSGHVRSVRVTCATNSYSLRGVVTGLLGAGLVLQNGGDAVEVQADGSFTFAMRIASGGSYDVRVGSQPQNPTQSCSVENGSGRIGNGDVTNVTVRCATSTFTVGGTISGLQGEGLVLHNNGADSLPVSADGSFTFNTAVPSGQSYNITVATQPTGPTQQCDVQNPAGTIVAENVTNVQITCVTTEFSIGGTVSGLRGSGLVLQNNAGDDLAIAADGSFTFISSAPTGSAYNVTVATNPSSPTQICTVSNGAGTINGADVTSVTVNCETSSFTVSAAISGMAGFFPFVQLRNNNGPVVNAFSDGTYELPPPVLSGETYNVEVRGGTENCTVTNGSGTMGGENVIVEVVCN